MSLVKIKSDKAASLDRIIITGKPDTFQARAYELQMVDTHHENRIMAAGHFFGHVAERCDRSDKETKADRAEAYQIIEDIFPELKGKGTRREGVIYYTLEEGQKSGLLR